MRTVHLGAALSVLAFSSTLFADQVVLKNGDRISGTITKSDDKTLLIKTEFAGDVEIQLPAVQEINFHAAAARDADERHNCRRHGYDDRRKHGGERSHRNRNRGEVRCDRLAQRYRANRV